MAHALCLAIAVALARRARHHGVQARFWLSRKTCWRFASEPPRSEPPVSP